MTSTGSYVLDTSTFINVNRNLPKALFSPVWSFLSEMADGDEILSNQLVMDELDKTTQRDGDDIVWAQSHSGIFIPIDEDLLTLGSEIIRTHPELVSHDDKSQKADPFVLAQAALGGFVVVCEEGRKRGHMRSVGRDYGLEVIPTLELLRREEFRVTGGYERG